MTKVKVLTETEIKDIKAVREDFQILVSNVGDIEIAHILSSISAYNYFQNGGRTLLVIQKREVTTGLNLQKL